MFPGITNTGGQAAPGTGHKLILSGEDSMDRVEVVELDKSKFFVTSLFDDSDEKDFWRTKTPAERLAAVELMRQINYGYDPLTTRLQRVLEVAQLPSS
jgi:hypothetical protein